MQEDKEITKEEIDKIVNVQPEVPTMQDKEDEYTKDMQEHDNDYVSDITEDNIEIVEMEWNN